MNLIGKPAPSWSGTAYHNGEKATLSSESLSGKWYVIYWYPLDFTFVCPTEIRGFQSLLEDFEDDGVTVIGASTDSFHS
jgi:peroxiredoxin (alkyl hydroperoxide reductase subunit C)